MVDTDWDPPVTAAVRLVSVLGDVLQHLGQAAYVRGLAERHNQAWHDPVGGSVSMTAPAPLLRRPGAVVAADLRAGGVRRGGRVRASLLRSTARARPVDRRARARQRRRQQRLPPQARVRPHPGRPSAEMLAVSRRSTRVRAPAPATCARVRLGRKFDAVFVHDAIEYMITEDDLRQAVQTAYAHCRPGGVAVLVPDDIAENFEPATEHGGHDAPDGRGVRYLSWTTDPDPTDTTSNTEYAFLLRERRRLGPGRPGHPRARAVPAGDLVAGAGRGRLRPPAPWPR